MWLSTWSHVKGLNDWQRLTGLELHTKGFMTDGKWVPVRTFLKVQKRWTEKDDSIKVCQREAVWLLGEEAEKGETWHRNSSQQRAPPTTFQACPLSLTGLSKLKGLFFWREGVRNPFPFSLLIFLQWLPTNPRNNFLLTLSPTSGSLVWISLSQVLLPSWTYLIHLHLFSSSFPLSTCETQEPERVSGSKPYAWHRVHRMQYK